MSAVAGWAGCWWWGVRNWWRLLGWPLPSIRSPVAASCHGRHRAVPLPPQVRAAFTAPAVPEELALLRQIFGPEEPPLGQELSEGDAYPPHGAAAGERMFRFGDVGLVRGLPVYWAQCCTCDAEGPEAGTADSALAWARMHPHQSGSPYPFRLLSTAPVRIVPMSGR